MMDWLAAVPHILLIIAISVAVGVGAMLPIAVIQRWLRRRDQRRWEVQAQIREMEAAIREEQLSDEERAWRRQWREQQVEIQLEARRRLGLPEEDDG
jgi:hypothetical protein